MDAASLNYHHLRYFWAVASDGNLTRTARRLRVSQSALSAQIRALEGELGEPLFAREGRRLVLTEAGRLAFAYAEEIFGAGGRLLATLRDGRRRTDVVRIGAVATLSRNFLDSFVAPLFDEPDARIRILSGRLDDLLPRLAAHDLDLVLSNRPAPADFRCRRVARQEVSLVGHPGHGRLRLPEDLGRVPLLLPTHDSETRTAFNLWCEQLGVVPHVRAEVDDMALLRLLARDTRAVALLPSVVVRDELRAGILQEHAVVPGIHETFYATTVDRRFLHPLVAPLLARSEADLLGRWLAPDGGTL